MPRFFVPRSQVYDDEIVILGEDAKHIISTLRMREGDKITVCDMQKTDYDCSIVSVFNDMVRAKIISSVPTHSELPLRIRLFQSVPKGDGMERIAEHAIMMGASEIIPVYSSGCQGRSDLGKDAKRMERFRKMAFETAHQYNRGVIPVIGTPISFSGALEMAKSDDLTFLCYEKEKAYSLRDLLEIKTGEKKKRKIQNVSFFVGPEKGFEEKEADMAADNGIIPVRLGNRILLPELAVSFVLSCLSYTFEQ